MVRENLVLLGLGLLVIAAGIGAGCTDTPAPNESAVTTRATMQAAETLRTPATLAPADALGVVTARAQAALDRLDNDTANASQVLGPSDMAGNETRRILARLARASPAVIDATAVSRDGIMLTVEPEEYASAEGADISDQEQMQRLRTTRKPVMSGVFPTVEGVNATDLEHPVFAPSGPFNGSASLLFRPTVLLTIAVHEALDGRKAEVFVVDTDGLVLYDRDAAEIGSNTFTAAQYAGNRELLAIAERMRTEPEGTGTYTFVAEGSTTPVRKEVVWDSVGLHGTEWRVAVVSETQPS